MSSKHFDLSAKQASAALPNDVDIEFTLDELEMVASPPSAGQLALFVRGQRKGGLDAINAMFDFIRVVLDEKDYKKVEELLLDGAMQVETVVELISWMVEEWSARPTKSSAGSSESPKSTGRRSTAKVPAKRSRAS